MQSSGLIHRSESSGRSDRPSRLDRIRPGGSLVLLPLMAATAWSLVIALFASISQLFGPEDDRGTWGDVAGAALGNFVMVFALMFAISAIIRASGRRSTKTPTSTADWSPPAPPPASGKGGAPVHEPDPPFEDNP
jgi:hypothetical protein